MTTKQEQYLTGLAARLNAFDGLFDAAMACEAKGLLRYKNASERIAWALAILERNKRGTDLCALAKGLREAAASK